ncbi:hypothetical protein O59_000848 [Cellvibrio sp. BR]|nr:hypothetical protein O59_000848 [Cellvibrio sp. BR]
MCCGFSAAQKILTTGVNDYVISSMCDETLIRMKHWKNSLEYLKHE